MIVPEIIIYNKINQLIKLVYDDFSEAATPEDSILYSLFNADDNDSVLEFETYNWFTQSKSMFLRDTEHVRELQICMGYNPERLAVPTIHILMPSDSKGVFDSLGKDEQRTYDAPTETLTIQKSQTFRPIYHLMITSDNLSEVLLVYYFLRAMFLLFYENFELLGLQNLQFTGQDIALDQNFAPPQIHHRNLSLQFDYESSVKIKVPQPIVNKINAIFCDEIHKDFNKQNNKLDPNIHDDPANYSQA